MSAKYLVVLAGPTASGKTAWCIELARHFNTEIISADSRQFYREMNIGTAKPDAEQRSAIPHHFVNSLPVTTTYNAGIYEKECLALADRLFRKHDLLIMCGGSGLYIDAVLNGMDDLPAADPELRRELKTRSLDSLLRQLAELDPVYCRSADLENPQRVIRALEVCLITGKPFSDQRRAMPAVRTFRHILAGIDTDRETLYRRIDRRVDQMMEADLLEEVRALSSHRHREALQTIGYRELFRHLDGEMTLETAVELVKKNTRHYAKRQLTWWRRNKEIRWFKPHEYNLLLEFIERGTSIAHA